MSETISEETRADAELITAVRAGDVGAYGPLFERHAHAARRLARQLTTSGEADDLVSDAFVKVLAVLQRGGGPDLAFRAYLLTAVRRLHVDSIRAKSRLHSTDDLEAFDPGVPFRDTAVEGFESSAAARAFASLPERWQLVLWHTEVEGSKPAEIGQLLGMSANSVSALAYRAREGLRQAFLNEHAAPLEETSCEWTRTHMGGYVRGGLSKRDAAKVDEHLDDCRACAGIYLELTEVNEHLGALIAPLLLGGAAAAYQAASSGGVVAAGGVLGRARDFFRENAAATGVAGVILAVALAAGGFAAVSQSGEPPRPSSGETNSGAPAPPTSQETAATSPTKAVARSPLAEHLAEGGPDFQSMLSDPLEVDRLPSTPPTPTPSAPVTTPSTPTDSPSNSNPTGTPSGTPTGTPSGSPSSSPTPTNTPSTAATDPPSGSPSGSPSASTSTTPTVPTVGPTLPPTTAPTTGPTTPPTTGPTTAPTTGPTTAPTTGPTTAPTTGPTTSPTTGPTTTPPTTGPTTPPTTAPTTPPTTPPTTAAPLDFSLGVVIGRRLGAVTPLRVVPVGPSAGDPATVTIEATTGNLTVLATDSRCRTTGSSTITCVVESTTPIRLFAWVRNGAAGLTSEITARPGRDSNPDNNVVTTTLR